MEKYGSLVMTEPTGDKALPLIPWWIANLFGFEYVTPPPFKTHSTNQRQSHACMQIPASDTTGGQVRAQY